MTERMILDGDAVAAVASSIDLQATNIPSGQAIDLGNCQSNTVIAAVDSLNVWAAANALVVKQGLQQSADDALAAAREFGTWDSGTAGGRTPRNGMQAI
jgi:hypothetical protein